MCGIFTLIRNSEDGTLSVEVINAALDEIKHRGPDSRDGIFVDGHFIGFQRLSVVDNREESNGVIRAGGKYLNCNGEIYNHKALAEKYGLEMVTGSDCEVILRIYNACEDVNHPKLSGRWPAVLNELDGVFAFTIYDPERDTFIAVRDRFGVRPLFSLVSESAIGFSSEKKALFRLTDSLPQRTKISTFAPGSYMTVNDFSRPGGFGYHQSHLWYMTRPSLLACPFTHLGGGGGPVFNMSSKGTESVVKSLLTDAVRKRVLENVDRPIGFFLSGGLDSSLVAAIGNDILHEKITTFSIGFPGSPDLEHAREVSEYLGSTHHEVLMDESDVSRILKKVIYHAETYDTTTIRASIPMYLLSEYVSTKTDVKILLSGEGADELFGGYLYFHKAPTEVLFEQECGRLLSEIHKYDVLRGDRMTAAHGLEIRVPFLDSSLVDFVLRTDPTHRVPWTWDVVDGVRVRKSRIEKDLLRNAFSDPEIIPLDVRWRQKEAFSDGVGASSLNALRKISENTETLKLRSGTQGVLPMFGAIPKSTEEKLYYSIYMSLFPEGDTLTDSSRLSYYWMPKWMPSDITDPSATLIKDLI